MTTRSFLSGDWEVFESWIEEKVGGDFAWKIRPRDTLPNRRLVAESITKTMKQNAGRFPHSGNFFLELEED